MSIWSRIFGTTPVQRAAAEVEAGRPIILAPRGWSETASDDEAVGLVPVYRALQILTTAGGQLSIDVERAGHVVTTNLPALVRRPDPDMDRSDWIEQAILSLALDGNLFIRKVRGPDGSVLAARILPPAEVTIARHPRTNRIEFHHRGDKLTAADVVHQTLMRLPGRDRGLGPIQAARLELGNARDVRAYATNWFRGSGQPSGLLISKGAKSAEEAREIRKAWNDAAADADNPTGVRVLGGDTTYEPLQLRPADAQWLEVRKFTVTELARLFGIPSALLLVSLDGNSLTYSNVEQEWLAFVRFTLMGYLRKIEESLTEISPMGQTIRFNTEGLLRTDTKSRYDAHAVALAAGFLTLDEVRAIENLPPLTAEQRAEINNRPTVATPAQQEQPA